MKCPACGRHATMSYQTGKIRCPSCGWGTEEFRPEDFRPRRRVRRIKRLELAPPVVFLLLIVSAAMVYGLHYLVFRVCGAAGSLLAYLIFGGSVAAYATAGWILQPGLNMESLRLIPDVKENPFLFLDTFERVKNVMQPPLYPGRIMGASVVLLVRLVLSRRPPRGASPRAGGPRAE